MHCSGSSSRTSRVFRSDKKLRDKTLPKWRSNSTTSDHGHALPMSLATPW